MTLLFDESLLPVIDLAQTFLDREECILGRVTIGPELVSRVCAVRPDVLVLSDRQVHPWPYIEELRRCGELDGTRLLLVVSRPSAEEQREALAGAGVVLVIDEDLEPRGLADAIAGLTEANTRVTVRAPLVFEVQGRSESHGSLRGQMLDVSAGGFRMRSEQRFEVGELIYCFFYLPSQASTIFATGKVVRHRELGGREHEYGLSFADIRLEDRRRIAEFVLSHHGAAIEGETSEIESGALAAV